jgi:hypothetical protein
VVVTTVFATVAPPETVAPTTFPPVVMAVVAVLPTSLPVVVTTFVPVEQAVATRQQIKGNRQKEWDKRMVK